MATEKEIIEELKRGGSHATSVAPTPPPGASPKPTAGPGPLPVQALNKLKASDPLAPLRPVVTGAARAAGTGIGAAFDILNRPHEAATAALGSGDPRAFFSTLVHGQSQESQDATRAQMRTQLGLDGSAPSGFFKLTGAKASPEGARYQDLPHWQQGIVDFMVDTMTDPLTYAGGAGALEKLSAMTGVRVGPALARLLEAASKSPNEMVRRAAAVASGFYDFTHFKGSTQRALAAKSGSEGVAQFQGLTSINNARRSTSRDLSRTIIGQYRDVVQGLKPEEETALYEAIHNGTVSQLPANLAMRAAAFKKITDSLAHLSGTPELRRSLREGVEQTGPTGSVRVGGGFEFPAETMGRFEAATPRGLQTTGEYRGSYVPMAHDVSKFAEAQSRTGIGALDQTQHAPATDLQSILGNPNERGPLQSIADRINSDDPALRERGDAARLLAPELQRKVIEARLRGGANAIASRDAEIAVAKLFGKDSFAKVPRDAQEFFRETYTSPENRQWWQHLAEGWKGAIDIPKVGLFALPFRHMANISTLSFLADPSLANVFGSAGRFARLLRAGTNAETRAKILGQAGRFGVSGTPSIDREAAGWIGRIPGVGEFYKAANHALWTFDDAVKATRFDRLVKRFTDEGLDRTKAAYRAASEVSAEMIDYSNRSPLTQALAYIAPFATYRSKFPVAIARITGRHPERPLALGRASPELVGDVQDAGVDENGNPRVGKSYLPLADTFRAIENPMAFARSTAGYPLQMLASAAGVHSDDSPNYFTYGKKPDLKYLANATLGSFPGGQLGLAALGQGEFANQGDLSGAIRGQTGFGLSHGPSLKNLAAASYVSQHREMIDELRRRGENAAADYYEKQLAGYLRYNHLYEK